MCNQSVRRGRTVDASRPSRAPRPNRAARPSESCKTNIQAEAPRTAAPRARPSRRHGPPRRGPDTRPRPCTHPSTRLCIRPTPEHSVVQTPDTSTQPHSHAQVTLDLLCSTLSYMKIMFCFYLYTSRLSAGLIMWDKSQFMFFFIFSSTFILT